ncbi:MAG: hypothetical protein QOC96_317 [Acidobacteriota bacterium]|jgi:hypothetical protein|nr:hypothetical protein [Acidobacteriota bacterium]
MKKWGLRILSAFLTFTLGLCAAAIVRFRLAPVAKVETVVVGANIQAQLPPTRIAENPQSTGKVEEDAQPTDEVYRAIQPHQVSISPYEIKRLIDENRRAAQLAEDKLDLVPIWEKLGIRKNETGFDANYCYGVCGADIFKLELDGKAGKEILLRLSDNGAMDYLYLIFSEEKTSSNNSTWNLLGRIDSFGWYWNVPHRVEIAGTKRWLVIGRMTGHGSGFGSYAEDWYEVNKNGVERVLSFQTELFIGAGANPMIDRKTKVLSLDYHHGIAIVVLQTSTSYDEYQRDNDFHLWSKKSKATFVKEFGTNRFSFDPLHSEILEKDLDPLRGEAVQITDEEFLKYNYQELAKLAVEGNAKQKEWLRKFLKDCDESIEKQSLQKALEGAQP